MPETATTTTGRSSSSSAAKEAAQELRLIHVHDKQKDFWYCKHVKHLGNVPARDRQSRVIVRPVHYGKVFSETTTTVIPFLNSLKCTQVFEYVRNGIWFSVKQQNIRIEVSQLYQVKTLNCPNDVAPVDEKHYMVQMTGEAPYDEIAAAESSMLLLADNLSNIVAMHNEIPKE